MKCDNCLKEFKSDHALNAHVDHSKRRNTSCYSYYILKYVHYKNFPWKKDHGIDLKKCECCGNSFKQLYRHLTQYSEMCFSFYIEKYKEEKFFPDGSLQRSYCKDCGKRISVNHKYCADHRHNNHNVMKDFTNVDKMLSTRTQHYINDPEFEKQAMEKISRGQKESFKNNPHRRENQRHYMLTGGASLATSCNKSPSKPQLKVLDIVKQIWPSAVSNYRLEAINKVLDIAIVELKLDIEYDGSYWHQDIVSDLKREEKIRSLGWKIYRFRDRIPSKEEIQNIILENKGTNDRQN